LSDHETCRVCGCTDEEPCTDANGLPCAWAEPGLCTECATHPEPAVRIFTEGEALQIIRAMRAEGGE
jgi:hypothetical protein